MVLVCKKKNCMQDRKNYVCYTLKLSVPEKINV